MMQQSLFIIRPGIVKGIEKSLRHQPELESQIAAEITSADLFESPHFSGPGMSGVGVGGRRDRGGRGVIDINSIASGRSVIDWLASRLE